MSSIAFARGSSSGWQGAPRRSANAIYEFGTFLTALRTLENIQSDVIWNGGDDSGRHIGLRVACAGLGNNDTTALVRVLLVFKIKSNIPDVADRYVLHEYATLTFTAGQMTGADGRRIADQVSAALGAYGTYLEAKTGARAASAKSATNDSMAEYDIPDIDNCDGIILDTQLSGGGSSETAQALYRFTT